MKRFRTQSAIAIAWLAVGGTTLLGAHMFEEAPSQEPPVPTFRAAVEAVELTVIVTDADGNPVSGLTEDDFEVLENGASQRVTTFTAVDIPLEQAERPLGEPDVLGNDRPPGRVYLIALDDMFPEHALRARAFLRQFIERYFGPDDTAAVVLTTRGLAVSGQEFTSNRDLLLDAIDRFGGGESGSGWAREKNIMGSLRSLTEVMAKVPGRKAILFVSRGLGDPDSIRDPCGCDVDYLVGYRPGPLGGLFANINTDFHRAISAATRGNVAIYPIDPVGLTTDLTEAASFNTSVLANRMNMAALAEITGGFALSNSNNYEGAFERLVREHSSYYLLGFNSSSERRDGRYVDLQVRVTRPGLQVRSLDGYMAPRDRPPAPRAPGGVLAAVWDAVSSPLTTSGVPMRVFAAPFRKTDDEATVAVALEIAASKLGLVETDGAFRGELEIILAITDARNRGRAPIRHRATLALRPETYERSALRVLTQLTLPEGRYQVRASAGGALLAGSVVFDVAVPDFGDDLSLSGIVLTSAQADETLTVSPHARMDVELPGPPTTAREFSRDDTLVVFAEVYESRRRLHTVFFATELRDASGSAVDSHTLQQQAVEMPTQTSVHAFAPRLTLADVPAGRYSLHVEARSSLDSRRTLTRDIPISVRE